MKLTYNTQMALSIITIILANILSDISDFWIYRSIGFVICGLIWIIHPIVMTGMVKKKQTLFWTRIGGVILILTGIFTRVHI